jgi:hypothetical protein
MKKTYELTINNRKIGTFKTLKAARNYKPDLCQCLELGINYFEAFTRIIKVVREGK